MAYYIHRERYIADVVPPKSIIKFPTLVNESLNRAAFRNIPPYKDMDEEEWQATVVADIYYQGCTLSPQEQTDSGCGAYYSSLFEGSFDINLPGVYLISWYVSSATGFAADGCFFQLKYYDYELQRWETPSAGSRLLVSASEFCTVIDVDEDCFPEPDGGKLTVALFNESDESLFMNRTPQVKAGFAIFGFNPVTDEQIAAVEEYIKELMEDCCGMGDNAHVLACIKWQLRKIEAIERDQDEQLDQLEIDWDEFYERFTRHTAGKGDVTSLPTLFGSLAEPLNDNLRLNYLRVGYIYHFWLSGTNVGAKSRTGRVYITPRVYNGRLLIPCLEFFNRPIATVGVFTKVVTSSTVPFGSHGNTRRFPLYIDKDGIYLDFPGATVIEDQAFLSFSIPLVLEEIISEG